MPGIRWWTCAMQPFDLHFVCLLFVDINECVSGHECDTNANCTDMIGTYRCDCVVGYNGTGFSCTSKSVHSVCHTPFASRQAVFGRLYVIVTCDAVTLDLVSALQLCLCLTLWTLFLCPTVACTLFWDLSFLNISAFWFDPAVVTCQRPTPPRNGTVSLGIFTYNQRLNFSCDTGYTLEGADHVLCEHSGQPTNYTTTTCAGELQYCAILTFSTKLGTNCRLAGSMGAFDHTQFCPFWNSFPCMITQNSSSESKELKWSEGGISNSTARIYAFGVYFLDRMLVCYILYLSTWFILIVVYVNPFHGHEYRIHDKFHSFVYMAVISEHVIGCVQSFWCSMKSTVSCQQIPSWQK